MERKFPQKEWRVLVSHERYEQEPPEEIIERFGVRRGMKVADVGCGAGFFLPALSARVGLKGKVYALEPSRKMWQRAKELVAEARLKNVEVLRNVRASRDWERLRPLPGGLDFILLAYVAHEIEPKERGKFFKILWDKLKPGGRLGILEWKRIRKPEKGPPTRIRLKEETLSRLCERAGFRPAPPFSPYPEKYALICVKPG